MSIVDVVGRVVSYLLGIIGIISVVGMFPSIVASIIFFVLSSDEKEETRKKSLKKKGWIFLILPFALMFIAMIGLVLITAGSYIITTSTP
jgi:hypothetical protein